MSLYRPDMASTLVHYGVDLPLAGGYGWQKILCPAHDERRPSCTVNFEIGRLHCKACGFSGDALDLVAEREHLALSDASEWARSHLPPASNEDVRGGAGRLSRRGVSRRSGHLTRDRSGTSSRLRAIRTRWD